VKSDKKKKKLSTTLPNSNFNFILLSFLFITHLELIVWQLTSHSVFIFYSYRLRAHGSQTTNFLHSSHVDTQRDEIEGGREREGGEGIKINQIKVGSAVKKEKLSPLYLYSILIPSIFSLCRSHIVASRMKSIFFGKNQF
jgi:hypothetical protein